MDRILQILEVFPEVNQLRKKWNFKGCSRKTYAEFPWILVFDLSIFSGCHTILQNFQLGKLVFSGISKGKVTDLKIPGGVFRNANPQIHLFGFFLNSQL